MIISVRRTAKLLTPSVNPVEQFHMADGVQAHEVDLPPGVHRLVGRRAVTVVTDAIGVAVHCLVRRAAGVVRALPGRLQQRHVLQGWKTEF